MLLYLVVSATAGVVAPKLAAGWITFQDYPREALQRGEQGATEFRVLVTPDGKPDRCEVLWSTGNKRFDNVTCSLIMRRARFAPALDEAGNPTYGSFHNINNFWQPGEGKSRFPLSLGPDIRLTVRSLPGGISTPVVVEVHVAVDDQGAFKTCSVPSNEGQQKLAAAACARLRTDWAPALLRNSAGVAVSYVKVVKVSFELDKSS